MVHVKDCWYVAAWEMDLPRDKPFAAMILGEPIVLWRTAGGGIGALADRCVHRHAPLSLGRCEEGGLRCMYHGLLFAQDGVVVEIPGQDKVPPQARVRAYPAAVRHSWIWIWMGDPAKADEALIPPAVGFDHPDFILGHGHLDYDAPARLINDNLLDLSHLSYVHAASFQAGPMFAERLPEITPLERGVRVTRWSENAPDMRDPHGPNRFDNYSTYDFVLPGVFLLESASFVPGTAQKVRFGAPDFTESIAGHSFTSQAVTPIDEDRSRYFFSWGPHRAHGSEADRDAMMKVAGMAFAEDKVMIEAQARVIARDPSVPDMPTAHDRGVTLFNRLVARLAKENA